MLHSEFTTQLFTVCHSVHNCHKSNGKIIWLALHKIGFGRPLTHIRPFARRYKGARPH